MPSLTIHEPGSEERSVKLLKAIVTLGASDADILLSDPSARDTVLTIEKEDGTYSLASIRGAGFVVNGKKLHHHTLAHGDSVSLGDTRLVFDLNDASASDSSKHTEESLARRLENSGFSSTQVPPIAASASARRQEFAALNELYQFSEQLMHIEDPEALLETLIDQLIRITRADKGFLVLVEDGELHVKVARNIERQNIENAVEGLSDSIVTKVLASRQPVIVSDALKDAEFNASESVVNLKLCSVMCVPLLERGGAAFGLIYLGNDRVANLFQTRDLEQLTIYAAQASLLVKNALLLNELSTENRHLKQDREEARFGELIGACDAMREVYRRLEKIAPTDISVLITGETGTGKELIAREVHRRSPRHEGPFITINCGAIPENLLESELFGHVKGAFTGAVSNRIGKFQAANGGTLFLDEVGELPMQLQVKLLRALQDHQITRVGDTRSETVDIRVVAATNRILEEEIKEGRFREDLYYRLNVVGLHLPPLRERDGDIEVIARHLLSRYAAEFNPKVKGFAPGALTAIRNYTWPGNIRQLENRLKKAAVLTDGTLVSAEDLDLRPESFEAVVPLAQAVEEFKERYVDEILKRNDDNRTQTARDLGVDARTVFRYLERKRARQEGRQPEDEAEAAAE